MSEKQKFIAIFPYFFVDSHSGLEVGGFTLKPSYKEVLDSEQKEIRSLLLTLSPFFRFYENLPITHWSYTIGEAGNETEYWEMVQSLRKIADTLRFTKLSDLTTTTPYSVFDFWLFQLGAEATDSEYAYFDLVRNGMSSFGFRLVKGEHKNTFQPPESLTPQLITKSEIEKDRYYNALYVNRSFVSEEDRQSERTFRAIEWFNRSFLYSGHGIDASEAIVSIHTALEALLRLDHDERNVKAQIKTALLTLLGHRLEIDQWFDRFHALRNSLVHGDVEPSSFKYVHPKSRSKIGNRYHLLLAREVFLGCLNAMLDIAEKFPLLGFEEKLIPNEIRVEKALSTLKAAKGKHWKDLVGAKEFSEAHRLRNDDITSPKEVAVAFGSLLFPHIRKELEENNERGNNDAALAQLELLEKWSGKNLGQLAVLYSDFEKVYRMQYFEQQKSVDQVIFRGCVYSFLAYASWRLLVFYG